MKTTAVLCAVMAYAASIEATSLRSSLHETMQGGSLVAMQAGDQFDAEMNNLMTTFKSKGLLEKKASELQAATAAVKDQPGFTKNDAAKAVTSAALQVKNMAQAINDGDTRAAISSALAISATIATAIPGGQVIGMFLALTGALVGVSDKSTSPPPLTLSDIKDVVKSAVQAQGSNEATASILSKCSANLANIQSEWNTVVFRLAQTPNDEQSRVSTANFISSFLNRMVTYSQNSQSTWSEIQSYVQNNVLVNLNTAPCYDTCYLTTTPLNKWLENPSNPDISFMNGPDWDPCPFSWSDRGINSCSGTIQSLSPSMKLCTWHKGNKIPVPGVIPFTTSEEITFTVSLDDNCKKRVDDISSCQDKFNTAKEQHAALSELLSCARQQTLTMQTLILKSLNAVEEYNLSQIANANLALDLQSEQVRLNSQVFYLLAWDVEKANTFKGSDGVEYQCDKPNDWVHLAGYTNGWLMNAPCTEDLYCEKLNDDGNGKGTSYCQDSMKCSQMNPNEISLPFDFKAPTYSYAKVFGEKWDPNYNTNIPSLI